MIIYVQLSVVGAIAFVLVKNALHPIIAFDGATKHD